MVNHQCQRLAQAGVRFTTPVINPQQQQQQTAAPFSSAMQQQTQPTAMAAAATTTGTAYNPMQYFQYIQSQQQLQFQRQQSAAVGFGSPYQPVSPYGGISGRQPTASSTAASVVAEAARNAQKAFEAKIAEQAAAKKSAPAPPPSAPAAVVGTFPGPMQSWIKRLYDSISAQAGSDEVKGNLLRVKADEYIKNLVSRLQPTGEMWRTNWVSMPLPTADQLLGETTNGISSLDNLNSAASSPERKGAIAMLLSPAGKFGAAMTATNQSPQSLVDLTKKRKSKPGTSAAYVDTAFSSPAQNTAAEEKSGDQVFGLNFFS
jgi:hypothetical protein